MIHLHPAAWLADLDARGHALVPDVLMRPLLLHASSPSTVPAHRRIVHLELAADDLPGGLEWHGRW